MTTTTIIFHFSLCLYKFSNIYQNIYSYSWTVGHVYCNTYQIISGSTSSIQVVGQFIPIPNDYIMCIPIMGPSVFAKYTGFQVSGNPYRYTVPASVPGPVLMSEVTSKLDISHNYYAFKYNFFFRNYSNLDSHECNDFSS